jgi:hypothetical protein
MPHVFIRWFLTAHSLRSLEAPRTLRFYFFFLSAERAERKKQHPFGIFSLVNCLLASIHMHCMLVIIVPPEADYFSFAVACIPAYGASQRQMKIIYFSVISPRRHSAAVALATRRRHSGFGASATMAKEASGFGASATAARVPVGFCGDPAGAGSPLSYDAR